MKKSLYIRIRNKALGLLVMLMPYFFYATALAGISSHKVDYGFVNSSDTSAQRFSAILPVNKQNVTSTETFKNSIVSSSQYTLQPLLTRNSTPNFILKNALAPDLLITCPGDKIVNTDSACIARVSNLDATLSGDIATLTWIMVKDGTTTASSEMSGINNILGRFRFERGTTTISYRVTDFSGVTETCSFTVVVNDVVPPIIVCPPDANKTIPSCETLTDSLRFFPLTVTDSCGIDNFYSVPALPAQFALGDTYIVWTTFDQTGNKSTCTQKVTVTGSAPVTGSIANQTNVACMGTATGSATIAGSGGTPPYQYNINGSTFQASGTFNNLAAGTYTVLIKDAFGCTGSLQVIITESPTALAVAVENPTNVLCATGTTGSATVTANGGIAPYTYSWSTSPAQTTATATGLKAGTYTVTVTDAALCSKTASVTITESAPIVVTISKTDILCFSDKTGTATALASGGTPPYTYTWLTVPSQPTATISDLAAGTYTVAVFDAAGCFKPGFVTINQPASKLIASFNQVNVACSGDNSGSITVTASGGVAPIQYSINGGTLQASGTFSNLTAGTYSVTARDANNCTVNLSVTITEPAAALTATITNPTNVLCATQANGSATVTASGGTAPYTYSWNSVPMQTTATATGLKAGTYTVTVTDAASCTKTASVTITEPTPIVVTISKTDVPCFGDKTGIATALASGGTPPYSYTWLTVPSQPTATVSNLAAGTYTVAVFDAAGCFKPGFITINQPASKLIASFTQVNIVCAGDNSGSITVTASGGVAPIQYNINGGAPQASGTFSNLAAGSYTVTAIDANNCSVNLAVTLTEPAALTATIANPTNVLCATQANGSATVTASGGTAPYTYSWNSVPVQTTATAAGLKAGIYTVTVTDAASCTKTANVTITEPTPIVVTISKTDVLCFGDATGTATALASGGTPPYNYTWLTAPSQATAAISNLAPGNYTLDVYDAAGCFIPGFVEIKQPDSKLTATYTQVDVVCAGNTGSITVAGSGGVPPYQYNINGGAFQASGIFNNLPAGIYTIITRDANNCTFNVTATIAEPANALHVSISETNVPCFGEAKGSATVTAINGTAPYTYSWKTIPEQTTATISNLVAGSYIVTTSDGGGCSVTDTAYITEPAVALSGSITNQVNYDCVTSTNGSVTVAGAGGTPGYQYSLDGVLYQLSGTFINLPIGNYSVVVKDANNCETQVPVSILPSIVADAGLSQELCNSAVATLIGNSPGTGTGSWTFFSGPGAPSISPSTGNVAVASGLTANSTPYIFKYSLDIGTCSTSDTMSVFNYAPVTPSSAGDDQNFCVGAGIVKATLGGNTPVNGTGLWSQLSGPTLATIQDATNPNTEVSDLSTGSYIFEWKISGGVCPPSTDVVTITVYSNPVADAGENQIIPAGTTASLTGTVTGGSGSYSWSWQPSDLLINSLQENPVTVPLISPTTFTLTVLDLATLCTDDASVIISIDNSGNIEAVADHDTTLVNASVTVDVVANDINPKNDPLIVSLCGLPEHGTAVLNSDNTITYTPNPDYEGEDEFCYKICSSINPLVCSESIVYMNIKLPGLEDLFVYTGVSPNSDGINDVWKIKGIERYPDNTVIIFNRWGDKLREFANYNNTTHSWNGKNENGDPLPDGTYFYILDVKDVGVLKGWIYIRGK